MIRILNGSIWILILFFCLNAIGQNQNKNYNKAINYASMKNIEQALSHINLAIKEEGNKTPALFYFHKYGFLVKLHKFEQAFKSLNESLNIHPNSVLLLNARAEYFYAFKMYQKAIADYQKIVSLVKNKELISYHLRLASIKFLVRDFEGVAASLQWVLDDNSKNIDALNLLASLYIELFEYSKAAKILEKMLSENQERVFTIINLGFVYQKQQNHLQAIICFNSALKKEPKNPIALSNRAFSKLKLSDLEGALSDINLSISLLQSNSYAYLIRGKIYLSLNNNKEACLNFKVAKKLNFYQQYGSEVDDLIRINCF